MSITRCYYYADAAVTRYVDVYAAAPDCYWRAAAAIFDAAAIY